MLNCGLDAVIFDFDGVIVESMDIKTSAFRRIFSDRVDAQEAIAALHLQHEGVDRLTKIEMICAEILHEPLSAAQKAALAQRFSEAVIDEVISCPLVDGALALLERWHGLLPMAVASGTPEPELQQIVRRRELDKFFCAVRGSPPGKSQLVGDLLSENGWHTDRVLLIGDAMTDYRAAADHGLRFIGRVARGRSNRFPARTIVVEDMTGIERAIAEHAELDRQTHLSA